MKPTIQQQLDSMQKIYLIDNYTHLDKISLKVYNIIDFELQSAIYNRTTDIIITELNNHIRKISKDNG